MQAQHAPDHTPDRVGLAVMKGLVAFVAAVACLLPCVEVPGKQAKACVSLWPAKFSATRGYIGEARLKGKLVHLLAYQNDVVNLAIKPISHGPFKTKAYGPIESAAIAAQGNAMLLPIPAKPGSMTRFNVVNSSTCRHFLQDMERAIRFARPRRRPRSELSGGKSAPAVQVFDTDLYTVVLAKSARDIPGALSRVPAEKRPAINPAIFEAYDVWYPGWTFALCCFNTAKQASARPLVWWYEPLDPGTLFFPAIDAHDGRPPDLQGNVQVDHVIAVGSRMIEFRDTPVSNVGHRTTGVPVPSSGAAPASGPIRAPGSPESSLTSSFAQTTTAGGRSRWLPVSYSDTAMSPDLQQILPTKIMGAAYYGMLPQGDFVFNTADVRSGRYEMRRTLPPGAAKPIAISDRVPALTAGIDVDYNIYLLYARREIRKHWTRSETKTAADPVVSFTVSRAGKISSLRLVKTCGLSTVDRAALRAVESASLKPLPPGAAPSIEVEFTFNSSTVKEAELPDLGPYLADLQRRIKRAWFPPRGSESKQVVLVFSLYGDGKIFPPRVEKSSGDAAADAAALKALENAAPFKPLPEGSPDELDIEFTFDYGASRGGSKARIRNL
jgi:TonB family protein